MARNSTTWDWDARINRVIEFITAHLPEALSLARLAKVAAFSPFHFHRIFHAQTGETLRAFVTRKRVERAVLLLGRGASRQPLTNLALELGFSSSSEFSRAFGAQTGMPPSTFRRRKMSKNPQVHQPRASYRDGHEPLAVRVVSRPPTRIAFVTVTDSFAPGRLLEASRALDAWRHQAGLSDGRWWGLSTDDPFVTKPSLCRYELGIEVPEGSRGAAGVHTRTVPGGLSAELTLRGGIETIDRGWTRLFAQWLPTSGYEPDDAPGVERFATRPDFAHWKHFELELSLRLRRR